MHRCPVPPGIGTLLMMALLYVALPGVPATATAQPSLRNTGPTLVDFGKLSPAGGAVYHKRIPLLVYDADQGEPVAVCIASESEHFVTSLRNQDHYFHSRRYPQILPGDTLFLYVAITIKPTWGNTPLQEQVTIGIDDSALSSIDIDLRAALEHDPTKWPRLDIVGGTPIDFGEVISERQDLDFRLTNIGAGTLMIYRFSVSGGPFASPRIDRDSIPPGDTLLARLPFAGGRYSGEMRKALLLHTNEPDFHTRTLLFTLTARAPFIVTPPYTYFRFSDTVADTTWHINLVNTWRVPITIEAVPIRDVHQEGVELGIDTPLPATVRAGDTLTISGTLKLPRPGGSSVPYDRLSIPLRALCREDTSGIFPFMNEADIYVGWNE